MKSQTKVVPNERRQVYLYYGMSWGNIGVIIMEV